MAAVWLKVFKQVGLYPFGKKARQKYDRVTSNEIATLRAFLLGQGLFTVAFDILTLGVFPALGGLRAAMYYGTGTRALRGYTSDYFSLFIFGFLSGFFRLDIKFLSQIFTTSAYTFIL